MMQYAAFTKNQQYANLCQFGMNYSLGFDLYNQILEIIIPEDYVSNISERLKLYVEADKIKDQKA